MTTLFLLLLVCLTNGLSYKYNNKVSVSRFHIKLKMATNDIDINFMIEKINDDVVKYLSLKSSEEAVEIEKRAKILDSREETRLFDMVTPKGWFK